MNKKLAYALLTFNALMIGAFASNRASANLMPECERIAAQSVTAKFSLHFVDSANPERPLREIRTIECLDAWNGRGPGNKVCTLLATGEGQPDCKFLVVMHKALNERSKVECSTVMTSLLLEK